MKTPSPIFSNHLPILLHSCEEFDIYSSRILKCKYIFI